MSEFSANRDSCFVIERPLINRQGIRCRAAGHRGPPASELFVSPLRIVVSQAMEPGHAGIAKLSLVAMQLLDVIQLRRDQSHLWLTP